MVGLPSKIAYYAGPLAFIVTTLGKGRECHNAHLITLRFRYAQTVTKAHKVCMGIGHCLGSTRLQNSICLLGQFNCYMRAARADRNQPEIVAEFRSLGWIVAHTHMVGGGFPDIVCSKGGITLLVEIKDGSKPQSARKLTEKEQEFHSTWQGHLAIIATPEDVFAIHRSLFLV